MRLSLSFDRTEVPYIEINVEEGMHSHLDSICAVAMFPVDWAQYAIYLEDQPEMRRPWYDSALLARLPVQPEEITDKNWPDLWVQGISLSEAMDYCAWLGPDYDLPTSTEQNAIYKYFDAIPLNSAKIQMPGENTRQLLDQLQAINHADTVAKLVLMQCGLSEWVSDPPASPQKVHADGSDPSRTAFFLTGEAPSLLDSRISAPQADLISYQGFRVVKRKPSDKVSGSQSINQLIYATVRADEWVGKRNGTHLAFRCAGKMSAGDIEELMHHLVNRLPKDESERLVFVRLSSDTCVLFRSIMVDRPEVVDRSGCILVHILLFTQSEWRIRGNNLFTVIPDFQFFNSFEDVLKVAKPQSPVIRPAVVAFSPVELTPEALAPLEKLWETHRQTVYDLLVLATSKQGVKPKTINFVGEAKAFLDLLRALMLLIPAPLRPECTFDTAHRHDEPNTMGYWAVVTKQPLSHPNVIGYDLANHMFLQPLELRASSPWHLWLNHIYQQPFLTLTKLALQSAPAYRLSEWISNSIQRFPSEDPLDFDLVIEFLKINHAGLVERAVTGLEKFLTNLEEIIPQDPKDNWRNWGALARDMHPVIQKWLTASLDNHLDFVRDGLTHSLIMTWFTDAFLLVPRDPASPWVSALRGLRRHYNSTNSEPSRYTVLWNLILECLEENTPAIKSLINDLPDDQYLGFVAWVFSKYKFEINWTLARNREKKIHFDACYNATIYNPNTDDKAYMLIRALLGLDLNPKKHWTVADLTGASDEIPENLDTPILRKRRIQILEALSKS